MRHSAVLVLAPALMAVTCHAQVEPAAAKVLEDAAAAAKALTSLSYTLTFKGELAGVIQSGKSELVMLRDPAQEGRWLKRWLGTHEMAGMPATAIQVSDQGDTITYINVEKKEWHKELARYVNPNAVQYRIYAWLPQLAEAEPYKDFLGATSLTMQPPENAAGVPCDVMLADFGPNQQQKKWWIGRDDHLPRKHEWTFSSGLSGSWVWEISDLKVNPPLTPAMFELAVPEGYQRFDPPAPVQPGATGNAGNVSTTMGDSGLQTSAPGLRNPGTTLGSIAPDFTLPMIALDSVGPGVVPVRGGSFTLSKERASVVVLDFFGSWNAQSKSAAPELSRMAAALRGKPVKVISLAIRERDENKAVEFLSGTPYAAGLLPAADDVAKLYKARVVPSFFVIGYEGEIVYSSSNYAREATVKEMQAAIEQYVATAQPGTPAGTVPAPAGGADDGDSDK